MSLSSALAARILLAFPETKCDSARTLQKQNGAWADESIWVFAKDHVFAIISKDGDFRDPAVFRRSPPGLVRLRFGNGSRSAIQSLLKRAQASLAAEGESCDVVLVILPRRARGRPWRFHGESRYCSFNANTRGGYSR